LAEKSVAIIGAGVTGLVCANYLQKAGIAYHIYEASDRVGGRVRTEVVGGFQLDVGFQIFLESYEEFKPLLDNADLDLGYFYSGATIYDNDEKFSLANPILEGFSALSAAFGPWATPIDKIKLLLLYLRKARSAAPFPISGLSAADLIDSPAFSPLASRRFFRPFFGDVFLDRNLDVDATFFLYLIKRFAFSRASLPAQGIQAIPNQLAKRLNSDSLTLNSRISENTTELNSYTYIVDTSQHPESNRSFNGTTNLYFTGTIEINPGRQLMLNVQDDLIRNACVISEIQPSYAPDGKLLISVSVSIAAAQFTKAELIAQVITKLKGWVGQKSQLEFIAKFEIPKALPRISRFRDKPYEVEGKRLRAGDAYSYPSLNGAAFSGRMVAAYVEGLN
jgi:hypothetical protein